LVYASEADLLNMALFGITAADWRAENPDTKGNIRDDDFKVVEFDHFKTPGRATNRGRVIFLHNRHHLKGAQPCR
jgi:hypothetical protein